MRAARAWVCARAKVKRDGRAEVYARAMRSLVLALALAPGLAVAQSTEAAADFGAPHPGAVAVHLRSLGPPLQVVLERRVGRSLSAPRSPRLVLGAGRCETPCTLWAPPGTLRLRSQGRGLHPTDADLEIPAAGAEVRVRAGRSAMHSLGVGLVAVGATTILATMFVALADQGIFSGTTRGSLDLSTSAVLGAAGVGAALLAGGIPLVVLHRNGAVVVPVALEHGAGFFATVRF